MLLLICVHQRLTLFFQTAVRALSVHEEAAEKAQSAGLEVVMDRCMKIEHARSFGGLNTIGMNTAVMTSRRRSK